MLRTWRRVRDYVKYDLREILFPSSLPYPPGEEELHKQKWLTWKVHSLACAVPQTAEAAQNIQDHKCCQCAVPALARCA
jgi:hypothetical protein